MNQVTIDAIIKAALAWMTFTSVIAGSWKIYQEHCKTRIAEAKEKSVGAEAVKHITEKLTSIESKFEDYRQEQFETTKQLQNDIHGAYIKMIEVLGKSK